MRVSCVANVTERLESGMQIKASNVADGLLAASLQNTNVKLEEKTAEVEKTGRTRQGHDGVQRTGVERSIVLYQGETAPQDAVTKRVAEIKSKLEQLINGASGLELLGIRQEGYSLNAADVEKIETVIDQIQVKLAAYCDSYQPSLPIDSEMAQEILGGGGLAGKVTDKFKQYGVPVTEDNLRAAGDAVSRAQEIETPNRNQAGYMAANGLEPSIENVYRAEHMPVQKNIENPLSDKDWEQLKTQAEKILADAGLEVTEDNLDTARWMIEQGIPMDQDMLRAFDSILSIDGEMSTDEIVDTIAQAMAKGKAARDALLTGEGYTQERVKEVFAKAWEELSAAPKGENAEQDAGQSETVQAAAEDLTRYRRLEETRLMMTVQAGLSLLKKGIEIETLPLSELVDALKEQEQKYYKALYRCDGLEASSEKLAQLSDVSRTIEALKEMPSYVVGMMAVSQRVQEVTVALTYESGAPLKAALDAAHTAYDALMTAPDREYGDSLSKAFQNIDDILEDMDRETTPENRRVIKILAYNQMELTRRNMDRVTELDREYQYLLKNLTPRVTMHMIEKHINPLETEIHELNNQIEQIKEEIGPEKAETYSEFLWKLEKQTDLSKEDRDAYIGLYRLLNQVDRTGEAAIGALVNQNREVTLENLLSAVRSRKARGMNVSVDDDFGLLTDMIPKGTSISEQLKGFMETMNSGSEEYAQEQKQRMQELSKESETLRLLAQSEEAASLDNLEASHRLVYEEASFLQRLQEHEKKQDKSLKERMENKEMMQEGYEELEKEAEAAVAEALENAENGRAAIEELRLFHRTVMLAGRLASFEDYHMPVEIDGKTCAVHVKLVHKQGESGKAELSMELPSAGSLRAEFYLGEESLNVFVMADSRELSEKMQAVSEEFSRIVSEGDFPELKLNYSEGDKLPPVLDNRTENTADTAKLYQITKEFISAVVKNVK
ncbi:MAG: hypothetical protein J6B06_03185 [Lachnospiraceae bacterium]|nr:hypothetical protein [Lachnospiraceae bacterium]